MCDYVVNIHNPEGELIAFKAADDYLDVTWRQIRRRCDAVGLSMPEAVA